MCKILIKTLFSSTILILTFRSTQGQSAGHAIVGNPLLFAHPCNGTDKVSLQFEPGLPPEEENQYILFLAEKLPSHSNIYIKFSDSAVVKLVEKGFGRVDFIDVVGKFKLRTYKESPTDSISFIVKGSKQGIIPYVTSFEVNTVEYCKHPQIGVLDDYIQGEKEIAVALNNPDGAPKCGVKKLDFTELITNSAPTKPGEWPWHAALYRLNSNKGSIKYICGGTLISKTVVVTAAHCATNKGAPLNAETLRVVLGKYKLDNGDKTAQEIEVFKVTVHPDFHPTTLIHDIAILVLKSEAETNDYIQPACLWDPTVKPDKIGKLGTIVGWGFDQTDKVSDQLNAATIPIVPDATCLRSHNFFTKFLTEFSFCAGYRNGTSPCNGDSGGGLMFPVRYTQTDKSVEVWHLRGVVSVSVKRVDAPVCDPNEYVIFTKIEKYVAWIQINMK